VTAPHAPGSGDAEGGSQDPRACPNVPYLHARARFPTPKAATDAAIAFPHGRDGSSIAEFSISPGLVRLSVPVGPSGRAGGGKRGAIDSWSRRSRSAMARHFATLDYSPWVELESEGWAVVMLTLTYPGQWQDLVPGSSAAVRHLRAFRERLKRSTGRPPLAIWKREFQRRFAPHWHLLLPLPMTVGAESIHGWVSRAWYEIVGSGDPRHLAAGTGIDWAEGLRMVDPVRVSRYFSGHAAPGGQNRKEYQNMAPEAWRDSGDVGRFWGYWGLKPVKVSVSLDEHQLVEVRRLLRGLDRSRSRTRVVSVRRVDHSTGEVYYRSARRRSVLGHLASGRLVGASLFTVDGPAVAQILARYLRAETATGHPTRGGEHRNEDYQ
jgi:hypothetical protein